MRNNIENRRQCSQEHRFPHRVGKVRHIEVNQLWLQGKVAAGEVVIEKGKNTGATPGKALRRGH